MANRTVLFLFFCFFNLCLLRAQSTTDTTATRDTSTFIPVQRKDTSVTPSVVRKTVKAKTDTLDVLKNNPPYFITDSVRFSATKPLDFHQMPVLWMELLNSQPAFNFLGKPLHIPSERYEPASYDGMFYLLILMLFYFAIVKLFFSKYLANLLTLFFRASMRQHQLREQVLQSPFPSLLLNNLFIFSGGLYGAFLLQYYQFGNPAKFWVYFIIFAAFLAILYLIKFLILKITGWIFNINRAIDNYLFVVFLTNKIIGIFLLPLLVVISFSGPGLTDAAITISFIMIGIFFIYRFIASFKILHKEIKISVLYYLLYLCAFEIAPLLLIYKVLVTYLEKAY